MDRRTRHVVGVALVAACVGVGLPPPANADGAVLGSTSSPPAEAAEVRDCPNFQLVAFVYDRSVRNMRCDRAKRLTRGSYGRRGFHFRAARRAGFRCRKIGSVYEGAVYRCEKGRNARAFRFTHGA